MTVMTVTGEVPLEALGKTLMHEHLTVGFAGWELDTAAPGPDRRALVALCVDRIEELKAAGYRTLLDPCPNDVGRDVHLMREVAAITGFNIICATGLYTEALGANAYWRVKSARDPDFVARLTDLMIAELTEGVGSRKIRAGVIKLATGAAPMSDYERKVFTAGARASWATGAPITTHTEAVLGHEQVALLSSLGVPAHRIIVGHCCGSRDHGYHMGLARTGAYVGFDRFGVEDICSDEERTASLIQMIRAGALRQLIVSHDSVWCLRGEMLSQAQAARLAEQHVPLRFERVIAPRLKAAGVTDADIDTLLVANPKAYFAGDMPPPIALAA